MTLLERLRIQYAEERGRLDRMLATCERENRDMSADEKTSFDDLAAQVADLKKRIEQLEAMDADDDEPPARGIRSRPPRDMDFPDNRGRSQQLRRLAPGTSAADGGFGIHTDEHRYSMNRALRFACEGRRLDGIEAEVHQELASVRSQPPRGLLIPLGNEPHLRTLLYGRNPQRRDLTTTTGTGGVFTTPDLPMIDMLRNRLVLAALGCTFLTGLDGKMAIPRQNAASTAYWVAEGVSVSPSNPTVDQVPLVDKTLGALVNVSRKLIYQSSFDADQFVKGDMAKVLAIALDLAGLAGTGTGATPQGIVNRSNIIANSAGVQGGPNGAVPTFGQLVAMESQVAASNADEGSLKYLTTPGMRGALKTNAKTGAGYPVFLAENNEVNGYPLLVSNNVPSGLTKGTSTNCHAIIFGNWADLIVATWGGIDTIVNPYTNQASGTVSISMMLEADVAVRHDESFSVVLDAKVA